MIIIFAGALGRFPVGGHAWTELHYLLGLQALGHTVYFLEDCGKESWVYNWETEQFTTELDYPTQYVRDCLEPFGLGDHWIYRAGDRSRGLPPDRFREICAQADLFIIRSLSIPVWREEYDWPQRRIYVDTDPGFTQIRVDKGDQELANTIDRCERLFSIGQRLGAEDCLIPDLDRSWIKTVFPIMLDHWSTPPQNDLTHFSSIMQWRSYEEVDYQGMKFGNKDKEFPKFLGLPQLTAQPLRMALTGDRGIEKKLLDQGWEVVPGWSTTLTTYLYRQFIQTSRAEFSVAKQGYVKMRGGWFSDRSVCYLASGRPVLVQDTGQSHWLPVGSGVLLFNNMQEAIDGIETINANYEHHQLAARHIAEMFFDSHKVLSKLLEAAMD